MECSLSKCIVCGGSMYTKCCSLYFCQDHSQEHQQSSSCSYQAQQPGALENKENAASNRVMLIQGRLRNPVEVREIQEELVEQDAPTTEDEDEDEELSQEINVTKMNLSDLRNLCNRKGIPTKEGGKNIKLSDLKIRDKQKKLDERKKNPLKKRAALAPSSSTSGPKSRGRTFRESEYLRILHVLADPANIIAVQGLIHSYATCRPVMDAGLAKVSPWDDGTADKNGVKGREPGPLNRAFNDHSKVFVVPTLSEFESGHYPLVAQKLQFLDPNDFDPRTETTLKTKYLEIQCRYTTIFERWNVSGQHDPNSFANFCPSDLLVQYAHLLSSINDGQDLFSQVLAKTIQSAATTSSISGNKDAAGGRKKKKREKQKADAAFVKLVEHVVSSDSSSSATPAHSPPRKRSKADKQFEMEGALLDRIANTQAKIEQLREGPVTEFLKNQVEGFMKQLQELQEVG